LVDEGRIAISGFEKVQYTRMEQFGVPQGIQRIGILIRSGRSEEIHLRTGG